MNRFGHDIVRWIACGVVVCGCATTTLGVEFAGGTGEPNDPYQIATAEQLIAFGSDGYLFDKHFVLIADIDLDPNLPGGRVFDASVIARPSYEISYRGETKYVTIVSDSFIGTFDGGGHAIRNFVIDASGDAQVGLFGSIGYRGIVKNLRVEGARVAGGTKVGLLIGTSSGTVSHCRVEGLVGPSGIAGGLVGDNHGLIIGCKSTATITGNAVLGGLAGWNSGTISSSYAMSRIVFASACDDTGLRASGGLVGRNSGAIDMSYAVSMSGELGDQIGGLIGDNGGAVYLSYWDVQASGVATSAGGRPKTTEQMMDRQTFLGWGQEGQWVLDEGRDYPRLLWEGTPGTLIADAPNRYGGGAGDPNDPYRIVTAEHLVSIAYSRSDYDKYFVLQADIDLKDIDPNLVYSIGTRDVPFRGIFDGNRHTIAHFTLISENSQNAGLFGYVDMLSPTFPFTTPPVFRDAAIFALHLTGVNVQGAYEVGGLVGTLANGSIRECSVSGVVSGRGYVGGLVGTNRGQIIASFTEGVVCGEAHIGGIAGRHDSGEGISSCYSSADVSGDSDVGGLVGTGGGSVQYCYATGQVTAMENTGGLVGAADGGTPYLSYWNTEVNPHLRDGTGQSRTTLELMQAETFRGWGVPEQWTLDEGLDYPRLAWEGLPGEPLTVPEHRYGGGTGEPNDPYQIWTAEQFRDIAYYAPDLASDFLLMADIDLAGIDAAEILPIGHSLLPFTGVFDGNHHTITGFRCVRPDADNVGVFGVLGGVPWFARRAPARPVIERITGLITGLHVTGVQIEGHDGVGGLVASNGGTVTACSATGEITGWGNVGGLVGGNNGTTSLSYAIVDVNGVSQTGGLAGSNLEVIESCYSRGSATAEDDLGGLVGFNDRHAELASCYAAVRISQRPQTLDHEPPPSRADLVPVGVPYAGGLIGTNRGMVNACLWDTEVAGMSDGVGNEEPDPLGVIGAPTSSMQLADTYTSLLWDFENIWMICEGQDYPRLQWEGVECR